MSTFDLNNKPTKTKITQLKKDVLKQILINNNLNDSGNRDVLMKRVRDLFYSDNSDNSDNSNNRNNSKNSKNSDNRENSDKNNNLKIENTTNMNCIKETYKKSELTKMKKNNLIEILNKLKLSNEGNKPDLVNRLNNYYRPNTNNNSNDSKYNLNTKDNTIITKSTLNLDNHYVHDEDDHIDDNKDNDIINKKDNKTSAKSAKSSVIEAQIIRSPHTGKLIAVDIENLQIYDKDKNGKFTIPTGNYWDVIQGTIISLK